MAKQRSVYSCQECGYQSSSWLGRCPECGKWNTFVEETYRPPVAAGGVARPGIAPAGKTGPVSVREVKVDSRNRVSTGVAEFDRVLGGGLVPGSAVLIGGDPGIGKSTILLQASGHLAATGAPVLYASGEESAEQIKLRAERLGVDSPSLHLYPENDLAAIVAEIESGKYSAVVVDSIQTVALAQIESAPGSVGQVRESAARLVAAAKRTGVPVIIVGHVTKEGAIAGPRVLEHIVDAVIYFEGDRGYSYRILRTVKNRFGSTNEIGVFDMTRDGLVEISNPSELFMSEKNETVPGSVIVACMEGTRPLLVEIQALVAPTSFGMPRRMTIGLDPNRVTLLVAILEKRGGLPLSTEDIYVNAVGGVRIDEPASDLGIASAVASSLRNRAVPRGTVAIGELGLGGEVRSVPQMEARLAEAEKLGMKRAIVPKLKSRPKSPKMELIEVADVDSALDAILKL